MIRLFVNHIWLFVLVGVIAAFATHSVSTAFCLAVLFTITYFEGRFAGRKAQLRDLERNLRLADDD